MRLGGSREFVARRGLKSDTEEGFKTVQFSNVKL